MKRKTHKYISRFSALPRTEINTNPNGILEFCPRYYQVLMHSNKHETLERHFKYLNNFDVYTLPEVGEKTYYENYKK